MHHREHVGRVISDKMQKTVVVSVTWVQKDQLYGKNIRRSSKLYAHDPKGQCHEGDLVRIVEVRPLSKSKRWLVREVVRKAEALGVKPKEIDRELVEGTPQPKSVEEPAEAPAAAVQVAEGGQQ